MIKIKIIQNFLERSFTVKYKGKFYYVDYLNSDKQILGLINRDNWQVYDEEGDELKIYIHRDTTEKKQIEKNAKLHKMLITFCIKHFDDYKPS